MTGVLNRMKKISRFNRGLYHLYFFSVLFFLQSCAGSRSITSVTDGNLSRKEKKAKIEQIIYTAKSYIGTPYKYGGTTKTGMDCSGLLLVSFNAAGLSIPRTSEAQANIGKKVSLNAVKPGDLVFFAADKRGRRKNSITHVGLVTSVQGDEIIFIHSSSTKGVREDSLSSDYWKKIYIKAMRPF